MKTNSFKMVMMALFISASSVVFAQTKNVPTAKEIAEKKSEMMKENLGLSKKQYKEVSKINLEYIEARKLACQSAPTLPNPKGRMKDECPKAKGECPQMKGECPKAKGECPQMKGECPKAKGECPQMKGDCPKVKGKCCHPKFGRGFMPKDSLTVAYHAKIKNVLTAAQYEKWIKMSIPCKGGKGCKK